MGKHIVTTQRISVKCLIYYGRNKMLLTDAEIDAVWPAPEGTNSMLMYARSIESAVLAKLREQEPVAYMAYDEFGMAEFVDAYYVKMTGGQLPFPNSDKVVPLFEHPAQIPEVEAKYNELLMAVAQKFPNETRHETALRYIMDRERWTEFKPMASARSGE
jgi:hypothetical protein